ncbi:MAG: L,D-transpeptidase family protein [Bacillota bacterium]|nr:L,D-transpeptidase family protein [Bacillota bacterium]
MYKKYPIASGRPGWPSPIGQWQIVEKSDWGEGFGGRWLGLNVIWGKYGIHGTTQEGSIGSAASHGCIRMLNKDIKELYNLVSIGTPVIIEDGSYGPFGTGFRELRPGDRGADVLAVQQRLKELGYFKGKNTGIYEDNLKQSLYKFQKEKGLRIKYTITKDDYHAMGLQEFE